MSRGRPEGWSLGGPRARKLGKTGLKVVSTSFVTFSRRTGSKVLAAALLIAGALAAVQPVQAQSWWPFGNDEPPRPREPMSRPPPQQVPAPIPPSAAPPGPQGTANWATKNPICLQLEQRLVQEGQKGNQSANRLPQIEAEMRTVDQTFNVGSSKLDKGCYEYFLFTKTFRNTPQCKELARQVEVAKRRLSDLEAQRQEAMGSAGRSYKDDIIRELARNNCGANYVDQARRRDGGVWQDEETIGNSTWTPQGNSGVATYRTLCVRLCDGFYFPVSFSTLPSHFPQDAEVCSSKCAAPTELYYYPNPGGTVDQSVALTTQEAYTKLRSAFRYRKEYVNGCSCKEAEYVPSTGATEKKAEADTGPPRTSASPAQRAAVDGVSSEPPLTTGSTSPQPPSAAEPAPAASGWETQTEPLSEPQSEPQTDEAPAQQLITPQ